MRGGLMTDFPRFLNVLCLSMGMLIVGMAGAASAQAPVPPPQLRFLEGHTRSPFAVAWAPDNKTIVSAGFDQTVRVWDRETGKLLHTWADTGRVLSLALTKNGQQLAAGSQDRKVRLFDMYMRDPVPTFVATPLSNEPTGLAYSADGTLLLSGDKSAMVRLWNPLTGAVVKDFAGSTGEVTGVALSPDGKQVLAACLDGTLRVWNIADGAMVGLLATPHIGSLAIDPKSKRVAAGDKDGVVRLLDWPGALPKQIGAHGDAVTGLAVASDGKFVASAGNDQTVQLLNPATAAVLRALPGQSGPVTTMALSPDDSMVVTGSTTGLLKFWKAADGSDLRMLAGHEGAVLGVTFHPNGKQVISTGADGTIRLWDLPQAPVAVAGHTKPAQAIAVSADGKVFATAGADNTIRLWTAAGKPGVVLEGHAQPIQTVAISADGKTVASGDALGLLRVWNAADKKVLAEVTAHAGAVTGLEFHPSGKHLMSTGADGVVRTWEFPAAVPFTIPTLKDLVTSVALSSDGKSMAVGSAETVQTLDATGKLVKQLGEKLGPVTAVALGAKNTLVAATTQTGLVHVWKAAGPNLGTLTGHTGAIHAVAFHPTEERFATAGLDALVRLWSLPTAQRSLEGTGKPATMVRVSPNGQTVAVASENMVRLFSLATLKPLPVLKGHLDVVTSLAWKADGSQLVTGGEDKSVRLWSSDGTLVKSFDTLPAAARSVAITPDGAFIVWGGADNLIHQLKTADGMEARNIPGATQPITAITLSTDGAMFAAGSADGSVRAIRVADGGVVYAVAHGAAVQAVALSADGTKLATSGADNQSKLWNATNGAPLVAAMPGHTGAVNGLGFTANNEWVVTSSVDGSVRVWDTAGKAGQIFTVPTVALTSVSLAVDNKTIVAGGANGNLYVFTRSIERVFTGHEGAVTAVGFAPNGQLLVTGGADKTARSWNLADGKQVLAFAGSTDIVTRLAVSNDNTALIAVSQDKNLRQWTLATAAVLGTPIINAAPIRDLGLSADSKRAVITGDDGLVRLFDLPTGKELQRFVGHAGVVGTSALSADGKTVVTAGVDKTTRIWSVAAQKVLTVDPMKSLDVKLTKDATQFLTSGDDKIVKLWDPATGLVVRQYPGAEAPPRRIAIRSDGAQILGGGSELATDKNVYLWDFATAALTKIVTPAAVASVAYSSDGTLVIAGGADSHLRIYRATDGKLLEDLIGTVPVTVAGVIGDGRTIAAARADNSIGLHRIDIVKLLTGHEGPVTCVTFGPKGEIVLTGGNDKTIRVWNMAEGKQISALTGSGEAVTSIVITPDGQSVIGGSTDKQVRLWSLPMALGAAQVGSDVALAQTTPVRSLALTADGTRLAVGGDDNQVHLWDLNSLRELERFPGHTGVVQRLAFARDGTLITGSVDKTVRTWKVAGQRALAAHQGPVTRLQFSPDGARLISGSADKLLLEWDATTLKEGLRRDLQSPVRSLAQSSDGKWVVTVTEDQHVRLFSTGKAAIVADFASGTPVNSVAITSKGDRVIVVGVDKIVRQYAVATKEGVTQLQLIQEGLGHTDAIQWLALGADDRSLFSLGIDRLIRRWQLTTAEPRVVIETAAPVDSISFSPDGLTLAIAAGKDITLVTAADGKEALKLEGHEGRVYAVAFHPGGLGLISCSADKTLRYWDAKGKLVRTYEGIDGPLYSLSFNTDGAWLVAGGPTKEWLMWGLAVPKPQRAVPGHNAPIYRISVNAANTRVATIDHTGELCVWDTNGVLLFHQSLPVLAGHSLAYSPDGKDLAVATQDSRLLVVAVPAAAQ